MRGVGYWVSWKKNKAGEHAFVLNTSFVTITDIPSTGVTKTLPETSLFVLIVNHFMGDDAVTI